MNTKKLFIIFGIIIIVVIGVILWINRPIVMVDAFDGSKSIESLREDYAGEKEVLSTPINIDDKQVLLGYTTSGDISNYGWEISRDFVDTGTCLAKFEYDNNGVVVGYEIKKKDNVSWDDVVVDTTWSSYLGQYLGDEEFRKGYFEIWKDGMVESSDGWYNVNSNGKGCAFRVDEDLRIIGVRDKL